MLKQKYKSRPRHILLFRSCHFFNIIYKLVMMFINYPELFTKPIIYRPVIYIRKKLIQFLSCNFHIIFLCHRYTCNKSTKHRLLKVQIILFKQSLPVLIFFYKFSRILPDKWHSNPKHIIAARNKSLRKISVFLLAHRKKSFTHCFIHNLKNLLKFYLIREQIPLSCKFMITFYPLCPIIRKQKH